MLNAISYKKPLFWYLFPVAVMGLAYIVIILLMSIFSLPPLLNDLPSNATNAEVVAFNISYLLTLSLLFNFYLLLPFCWVIGTITLIRTRRRSKLTKESSR